MSRAKEIAEFDAFARLLNTELVEADAGRAVVRMPYREDLGMGRVHGGAISALVDIAATASFWSYPDLTENALGATVGFDIHFMKLAQAIDLVAESIVRRRGGSLCLADVTVRAPDDSEIAAATVTYKLNRG